MLDKAKKHRHRIARDLICLPELRKLLLSREQDMALASAIEFEAMTQALLMNSADHHEFV